MRKVELRRPGTPPTPPAQRVSSPDPCPTPQARRSAGRGHEKAHLAVGRHSVGKLLPRVIPRGRSHQPRAEAGGGYGGLHPHATETLSENRGTLKAFAMNARKRPSGRTRPETLARVRAARPGERICRQVPSPIPGQHRIGGRQQDEPWKCRFLAGSPLLRPVSLTGERVLARSGLVTERR